MQTFVFRFVLYKRLYTLQTGAKVCHRILNLYGEVEVQFLHLTIVFAFDGFYLQILKEFVVEVRCLGECAFEIGSADELGILAVTHCVQKLIYGTGFDFASEDLSCRFSQFVSFIDNTVVTGQKQFKSHL